MFNIKKTVSQKTLERTR